MAVKASKVVQKDLTAVAVANFSSTVNTEIETEEAGDWVLFASQFVHVADQADGSAKFMWLGTFQKHEIIP